MDVGLILSIVIAGATVFYTGINYLMLKESKRIREQKITPIILAFLKSTESHTILALHLKNIGEGVAKNVQINLNQELYQYDRKDHPLSEVGIFKNGFNIFPPDYELKYHIHSVKELYRVNREGNIDFEVSYENINGKKFKNHYSLEFSQMFGQNYSTPPESYAGQTPYYLKEINKTLTKIKENKVDK